MRLLRLVLLLTVYLGAFGAAGLYFAIAEFDRDLPRDLSTALDYRPNRASRVYSADGELIGEFFLQKRVVVARERIPPHVAQAFVSAEDGRFWEHPGFDVVGIVRAAYANFAGGGTKQGASTITQQVTRMLLLSNERTYLRKIRELILSVRVERELSKADILNIYLNQVYLGRGAYGVQAGAEVYFAKDVEHLTVAEASMLAGLVQAPSRYAPHRNMAAARERQAYVLQRMHDEGYLSESDRRAARVEPLALIDSEAPLNHVAAPYFVEHVRRWATDRYGQQNLFYGGLRLYTTLDMRMQGAAERAVTDGLDDLDRDIGFRGPLGHLREDEVQSWSTSAARPYVSGLADLALTAGTDVLADVRYLGAITQISKRGELTIAVAGVSAPLDRLDARTVLRWRGEQKETIGVGDLIPVRLVPPPPAPPTAKPRANSDATAPGSFHLAQLPDIQGALVAIEPQSGRVRALVGGYDYVSSQFNRVTQAKRQIGSAIKPFIYSAALARGRTEVDVISDAPVVVRTVAGLWAPRNYDGQFLGPVTMRTAIAKSLNTVSVRLLLEGGIDKVVDLMRAVGISSPIPRHISIALGTPDLSLLEVAAGYGAFATGGLRVDPRFLDLVVDGNGRVVDDFRAIRPQVRVMEAEQAYLTTDLLGAVVKRGTARGAQVLGRPTAGKTGTSTGHRDAWFIGYTTDIVVGTWVGRDDFTPIGAKATGGGAALPIWTQFLEAAHPSTPVREFDVPPGIIFARADELTGAPVGPGSAAATWLPFAAGTLPARFGGAVKTVRFAAPRE